MPLTWASTLERVTGIEPALSAWEAVPSGPVTWPDLRRGLSASDRERPFVTGVNGPLMARRTAIRAALIAVPWSSPVLLDSCRPSGRGRRCQGSRSDRVRLGLDTAATAETIEQRGGRMSATPLRASWSSSSSCLFGLRGRYLAGKAPDESVFRRLVAPGPDSDELR